MTNFHTIRFRLLGLLLLMVVGLVAGCNNNSGDENQVSGMEEVLVSQDLSNPNTFDDIPVGFTEEGYPFRGDPDAPVTVVEFSDYLCPYCGHHTNNTMPALLDQYARTGKVKFVFRDFPIEALHPTADIGHAAALCIAEQGAEFYWTMHDQLYLRQNQWSGLPDPTDFVRTVAEAIGADMDAYDDCYESGRKVEDINNSVEEAISLGFNGTPSFLFSQSGSEETHPFIGAQPLEEFSRWFDALANTGAAPVVPTPKPPVLPYWATAEGLQPDPDYPGYTMAGDAYKGNPEAKLVVVELSDFQCPACRTHVIETQPVIDEQLVDTGEIMWVMKHLPLSEHRLSPQAAAAAECAGEQEQFWEMHDLLYTEQESWANDQSDDRFLRLASSLNLDMEAFEACLNNRAALERVINDLFDAQEAGIFTTPTFIMLYNGDAVLLNSSREANQFITILKNALDEVNSTQ